MKREVSTWLGGVSAAAILVAACAGSSSTGAELSDEGGSATTIPADEPTSVETSAVVDEVDEVDEVAIGLRDPAEPIAVDASYQVDAEPKLDWFEPFEPGSYRTGAIGTPMSFTTTEPLNTQENGESTFVLTDVSSQAPDDRDLRFVRVGAFSDPVSPNAPIEEQSPWPNDDFRGWLAALHDDVLASEPVETNINGHPALRVDISLSDDIECGFFPGFCVGLVENNGHRFIGLNKGATYRVWIVEQGDEDPLAIVNSIARDEDASWFSRSDSLMDTIAFGEIAPNPIQRLVPGLNRLNVLGGVEAVLPDDLAELTNGRSRLVNRWNGRGVAFLPITDQPAQLDFADQLHDVEGKPLASIDEVVDVLAAAGVEVTELDAGTIGGLEARTFDLTNDDVGAILLKYSQLDLAASFFGWDAPAASRMWLIEHSDGGVMMIEAKVFDNADELLPGTVTLGEAIVESLVFTS